MSNHPPAPDLPAYAKATIEHLTARCNRVNADIQHLSLRLGELRAEAEALTLEACAFIEAYKTLYGVSSNLQGEYVDLLAETPTDED